ncbi:hypothetical protein FHL15_005290 [Xylaria flabelliformis]|uniref:Amidase domain-containing protein n=1 Tax=Xylaria flabelliformis TaxID=2512241 RepID=A0A553I133_9PEZI|nr:hypothetical protein FHL15_005290 [Xylaria flabelliformis]
MFSSAEREHEWQAGKRHGLLHGIPIILKDNIVTDLSLGKANLSELMNGRGTGMMAGWSVVGSQYISPYVQGGIKQGDKHAGHRSPGRSSTGSAVGVSAGFAPVAIDQSYTKALKTSWSEPRVGTLRLANWRKDVEAFEPDPKANAQMDEEIMRAYRAKSSKSVDDITLTNLDISVDRINAFESGVLRVRSVQQLTNFNTEHHDQEELLAYHPRQEILEMVVNYPVSILDAKYKRCLEHLRLVARDQGIDHALQRYDGDVIIRPADSELAKIAAAAGYPIATMPLSYLKLNGRPFGIIALASANQQIKLIKAMSA